MASEEVDYARDYARAEKGRDVSLVDQVDTAHAQIDKLQAILQELNDRTKPVRREMPSADSEALVKAPVGSPLGIEMARLNDRIQWLQIATRDLIISLEL